MRLDALAHAMQPGDAPPFDLADRRRRRAHQEGVADSQPLERLVEHSRRERFEIEHDVGEFRHASLL
jgi:hypothetical protein